MKIHNVSDELLNAFVDNELEPAERDHLFNAIEQDDALKTRACDLNELKKILQHAYTLPAGASPTRKIRNWRTAWHQALAASLLLLLFGGTSGWVISANINPPISPKVTHLIKTIQSNNIAEDPDKIIVQVSNANPVRLEAALDETETLLRSYQRKHHPLTMEIIANGGGLDLLRVGISPFAQRVMRMKSEYPNLHFYACSQTVMALRNKGIDVQLLPNTELASSALDEIDKRVRQGWDYVRI